MAKQFKKGKFSKLEQEYVFLSVGIYGNNDINLKRISQLLNRSESSIIKLLLNNVKEMVDKGQIVPPKDEIPIEEVKAESHVRNLFARREGIAVMTPGASEAIDDIKKAERTGVNKRNEAAIFRQGQADYSEGDKFNSGKRY